MSNIANALQLLGQFDEAITWHDKALELRPDDIVATWNRSHIFLINGDLLAGWDGYERRFELKKAREKFYPHEFDVPKWDGSSFKGKRLFIHDEQGIGDIIQFARYMPLVKEKGGRSSSKCAACCLTCSESQGRGPPGGTHSQYTHAAVL